MLLLGALPEGAGGDLLFPLLEEGDGKQVRMMKACTQNTVRNADRYSMSPEGLVLFPQVPLSPGRALVWPTTDREGRPEARAARQALPLQSAATKYVAMTL